MAQSAIPAAQYLRMSTDHQQYSLDNQADAIAQYADAHGFLIVKTFSDEAKSGLSVKRRNGLKQLLKETVEGHADFKAILVYDVSRWGRFQDADEAAHYEFLCKSSGAPVYYCAETFSDENGFSATILKALKRTMAGEYSRELSVKVRAGQRRLAELGYKLGGSAPYGLRRMLLDSSGKPKQILAFGERKSLLTERVVFVPGAPHEVAVVQRIFREFTDEHRSLRGIARGLNSDGIQYLSRAKWKATTVTRVLRHAAYMGTQIWGRTSTILSKPRIQIPPHQWTTCHSAFEPIISKAVFERAQLLFESFPTHLTSEQLLDRFTTVLRERGELSGKIIKESPLCPKLGTIRRRFGGLNNVYIRLGLPTRHAVSSLSRRRWQVLRGDFIKGIVETFPDQLEIFRRGARFRALLKLRKTGLLVPVLLAPCYPTKCGKLRWLVHPPRYERRRLTVIVFLDEGNTFIERSCVFRNIPFRRTKVHADSEWLRSGVPLKQTCDLLGVIREIRNNAGKLGT
ncbi:MAG: recombinase family protein [Candidatus Sulfotelmatobacter sp.]